MKQPIKFLLALLSIRLKDELKPLERRLLSVVSAELPPELGRLLLEQMTFIKYIDRYDPKHYINCFPGKRGVYYPAQVLFPSRQTQCVFAEVHFTIKGFDPIFLAKLTAVRGGFFNFMITPYFNKISSRDAIQVERIRVYPERLTL